MSFKTRQIRQKPRPQPLKKLKSMGSSVQTGVKGLPPKTLNYLLTTLLAVVGMFVVFKVTVGAFNYVSQLSPATLIDVVAKELKTDEDDRTNILLLGDGGYKREGAGLVDSIIVVSLNHSKKSVTLLSIPRDFYVTRSNPLSLDRYGKINEIYVNHSDLPEAERFEKFKQAVGELVNLDIQYYMRVDFKGFVEVVDALGGVTVEVPNAIYDPAYPNATDTGVLTFQLSAGVQQLDGETALKFARSRHNSGGFDRDHRQQLLLQAIQEKALSLDILTDPSALSNILEAIKENFNSDLTLREMAALGSFAQSFDRTHLIQKLLHDNPSEEGGFLYVPQREVLGTYGLLPYGDDLSVIHQYTNLIFAHPEMYFENAKIEVLNATKFSGIAGELGYYLNRFGFDVQSIGNYLNAEGEKQYTTTSHTLYHDWTTTKKNQLLNPKFQATLEALELFVKGQPLPAEDSVRVMHDDTEELYEGVDANISIVLGDDYLDFQIK